MRRSLEDLISLFFPVTCKACGNNLVRFEIHVCTYCRFHLPKTNFHEKQDHPLSKVFWGKVNIESASALYYFTKGGKVQRLIHQLKYKGNKEIGTTLGNIYATDLKAWNESMGYEIVIPVPLHKNKLRKRGYNQSEYFGKGLADGLNLTLSPDALVRNLTSDTQTRKSRFSRWENVEKIFSVRKPDNLINKKILLVDDVLTTGATLEACAAALLEIPGTKVGVAAIAYTL